MNTGRLTPSTLAALARAITAWTLLIGTISFELFGHLNNVIHDHHTHFDHEMRVLAAGLLYSRRPPSPYVGRFADIVDVLLLVSLLPVACLLTGFYGYVQGLFASLGG